MLYSYVGRLRFTYEKKNDAFCSIMYGAVFD